MPELEAFAHAIKKTIGEAYAETNRKMRASEIGIPFFVKFAVGWLQNNSLRVVLSDKDEVFVVVHERTLEALRAQQMSAKHYKLIPAEHLLHEIHLVETTYLSLCSGLGKLGFVVGS